MNVKQSFVRLSAMGLLVLAAGCTLIPLSSLWSLRKLELAEIDGAQLRSVIYLPAEVSTAKDAVRVIVKAERGVGNEVREWTLALRPTTGALAAHSLTPPRPGGHWVVLGLDATEQQRLGALRQQLQAWKAADGPDVKRRVSMSVEPRLCRRGATPMTAGDVVVDAWLRWKGAQEDLRMLDGATGTDVDASLAHEALPACE